MGRRFKQLQWLLRRLSRISLCEWPYRLASLLRAMLQYAGAFTAAVVDAADNSRPGALNWVRVPATTARLGTAHRQYVEDLMHGRLLLLGQKIQFDPDRPQWQHDPLSGSALPAGFGLFLDFRHMPGEGDIKFLWEFNRHLWWVPVAQAYAITHEQPYLHRLRTWLRAWLDQCPYPLGPNWSSPVEHGVRLLNWSLVWQLVGGWESALFEGSHGECLRTDWLRSIYQHLRFASDNYSRHSSADNHLIGEAAGVFVGAHTWNYWPQCEHLAQGAQAILEHEIVRQFSADGVNLEQSLNYQKFSLEFLLAAALCARANGVQFSSQYWRRLDVSLTFVAAMLPANGSVPAIGDSDDSRVLGLFDLDDSCPYRSMLSLGAVMLSRTDLLAKALQCDLQTPWLCQNAAHIWRQADLYAPVALAQDFRQGGYFILGDALHTAVETRIVFDTGALGLNRVAGHGHADALSLCLSHHGMPLLIDSGTYCYNTASSWRHYFRGTSAHNTLTVDGRDQADYGGSFLWLTDVHSRVDASLLSPYLDRVRASHDGYLRLNDPVRHVRQLSFDKGAMLLQVQDSLECRASHEVAIYWHFHPDCAVQIFSDQVQAQHGIARLVLRWSHPGLTVQELRVRDESPVGWVSPRFHVKTRATTIVMKGVLGNAESIITSMQLHQAHQHRQRPPYSRTTTPDRFGALHSATGIRQGIQ